MNTMGGPHHDSNPKTIVTARKIMCKITQIVSTSHWFGQVSGHPYRCTRREVVASLRRAGARCRRADCRSRNPQPHPRNLPRAALPPWVLAQGARASKVGAGRESPHQMIEARPYAASLKPWPWAPYPRPCFLLRQLSAHPLNQYRRAVCVPNTEGSEGCQRISGGWRHRRRSRSPTWLWHGAAGVVHIVDGRRHGRIGE